MNKSELIDAIQAKVPGSTKKVVGEVVDALTNVVSATLSKGDSIALVGFGTFKTGKRAAREGTNPSTKAPLKIAACVVPKFTPGAKLKDAVNGK